MNDLNILLNKACTEMVSNRMEIIESFLKAFISSTTLEIEDPVHLMKYIGENFMLCIENIHIENKGLTEGYFFYIKPENIEYKLLENENKALKDENLKLRKQLEIYEGQSE
jgi:hypothetical protein